MQHSTLCSNVYCLCSTFSPLGGDKETEKRMTKSSKCGRSLKLLPMSHSKCNTTAVLFPQCHSLWAPSLSNLVQKGRTYVSKQDPHKQDMMWLTRRAPISPIGEKPDRDCPFKTCGWPAPFPVSSAPLCSSTSSNCPSRCGRSNCT